LWVLPIIRGALNYIADLTFYFMQQEKHLVEEFVAELEKQLQMADALKSPRYSQGIRDSIAALRQEIEQMEKREI